MPPRCRLEYLEPLAPADNIGTNFKSFKPPIKARRVSFSCRTFLRLSSPEWRECRGCRPNGFWQTGSASSHRRRPFQSDFLAAHRHVDVAGREHANAALRPAPRRRRRWRRFAVAAGERPGPGPGAPPPPGLFSGSRACLTWGAVCKWAG